MISKFIVGVLLAAFVIVPSISKAHKKMAEEGNGYGEGAQPGAGMKKKGHNHHNTLAAGTKNKHKKTKTADGREPASKKMHHKKHNKPGGAKGGEGEKTGMNGETPSTTNPTEPTTAPVEETASSLGDTSSSLTPSAE